MVFHSPQKEGNPQRQGEGAGGPTAIGGVNGRDSC